MKKILFLFLFLSVFLVACGNKKEDDSKTIVVDNTKVEYEEVELTLNNYYKYITIYEDYRYSDTTKYQRTYYNFSGAEGCRFEDCTITYSTIEDGTIKLSISGEGQVIVRGNYLGNIIIKSITGTVKYPKI